MMGSKQLVQKVFKRICGDTRSPTVFHPLWLFVTAYQRAMQANSRYVSGRVLDLGAGDRYFEKFYAQRYTHYIAFDYPETQALHGGADLPKPDIAGDGCYLPIGDKLFDTVLLFEVLEHSSEPETMLREAARVLRTGGIVLITAPLSVPEHSPPHDYFRYTQYGHRVLLEKAGFSVEQIQPIGSTGAIAAYFLNYSLFEGTFRTTTAPARMLKLLVTPLLLSIWVLTNLVGYLIDHSPKDGFVLDYCIVARKQ